MEFRRFPLPICVKTPPHSKLRLQPLLRHTRVARFVLQLLPRWLKCRALCQQIIQPLRQAGALLRIDLRVGVVRVAVGISVDVRITVDVWIAVDIWISVHVRVAVHVGISIDIRRAVDVWKDSAIATTSISSEDSTIRITWNVAATTAEDSGATAANVWKGLRTINPVRCSQHHPFHT